jgi:glycyl-tRNA synthetase beta chain
LGVIRIALSGPMDVELGTLLRRAHGLFPEGVLRPEAEVLGALDDFFRGRLKALHSESHPTDLVQACLGAWDGESIRDLSARIEAVAAFRQMPEYESLAIAFKRAFNISKDAPAGKADPSLYSEDAEKALAEVFEELRPSIEGSVSRGAYDAALGALAKNLKAPIDRFFDEVLVIHDDEKIRDNRLRLLGGITATVTGIVHFHELST